MDNGKENGNYRDYGGYIGYILGLYWDTGKMETTVMRSHKHFVFPFSAAASNVHVAAEALWF